MPLLTIDNLHARVEGEGHEILKGISLQINPGEVHAIMGPNGSGKSTLASVLAGNETYEVTEGTVTLDGADLLEMDAEERAREGLFLAFQYPVELPGVSAMQFMKTAVNAVRKHRQQDELGVSDFLKLMREKAEFVGIDQRLVQRAVNDGFSGGEKKKNEIFQMAMLDPKMAVLDETDSGLDIDALRIVSEGVNRLRAADRGFPRHHALPAPARPHRAGLRARTRRRPHRALRRQGARDGAGGEGLRLDQERSHRRGVTGAG